MSQCQDYGNSKTAAVVSCGLLWEGISIAGMPAFPSWVQFLSCIHLISNGRSPWRRASKDVLMMDKLT